MTANKHTPGPWHVHKGTKWHHVRASNGNWVMEANYSHSVVRQHADARLIAAAPELLEALTRLTSFVVTEVVESCNGNKCREPWCAGCFSTAEETVADARDALAKAHDAIAQATGGAA